MRGFRGPYPHFDVNELHETSITSRLALLLSVEPESRHGQRPYPELSSHSRVYRLRQVSNNSHSMLKEQIPGVQTTDERLGVTLLQCFSVQP